MTRELREKLQITIESLLDTYTVEEILELSDVSPVEALTYLVENDELDLPEVRPITWEASDLPIEPNEELET